MAETQIAELINSNAVRSCFRATSHGCCEGEKRKHILDAYGTNNEECACKVHRYIWHNNDYHTCMDLISAFLMKNVKYLNIA